MIFFLIKSQRSYIVSQTFEILESREMFLFENICDNGYDNIISILIIFISTIMLKYRCSQKKIKNKYFLYPLQ